MGENHELDVDVDNEVASLDTNNNNSKPPSIFASPCTNCGLPYCNGVTCVLRRSPLRDTSPQRHDNLEYVVPMERTEDVRATTNTSLHLSDLPNNEHDHHH